MCPVDGEDKWGPFFDLRGFKDFLAQACKIPEASKVSEAFAKFWDEHVQLPRPDVVYFSAGKRFTAAKARIQARPKEYYAALLKKMNDECTNKMAELALFYIIGAPKESP